jgi:hypothetical protein
LGGVVLLSWRWSCVIVGRRNKHRLITFDIKDLYVNIPIQETINITKDMLQRNNDPQTTHQILTLLKIT